MEVVAKAKYIRQSPRKLREVAELLAGKEVNEALDILNNTPKRGAEILKKSIGSALSNARNKSDEQDWKVKIVMIDEGPTMKRFRAATMGRAVTVKKRMSHITVVLEELQRRKK